MESLAYIHQAIAYTDPNPAPIITLWQRFNGQKRPSSGWLKLLGIGIIVAAAISLSEVAHAATVRVKTEGSNLNVRVQPNTSSAIFAGLENGTIIEVADTGIPNWYVITSDTYRNYYIYSPFTVPIKASDDPIIGGTTGKMQVKTDNGLGINVRESPSSNSRIKGGFSEREIISVAASDTPGWSRITEGNLSGGFVNNDWLVSVGTVGNGSMQETPLTVSNPATERNYVIKTSGSGVNVRALPIETSERLQGLDDGQVITAKASGTEGWLQITSGDLRGRYIRSRWAVLSDVSVSATSFGGGSSANYRVRTNSRVGVTVRSNPNIASRDIGSLSEGAVVKAVPFNSEWLQLPSGGYISRQWADPTGSSSTFNPTNPGTGNYVVNTNKGELMVRSAPRYTARAMGGLQKGQRISAVASGTSGWLRINAGPYAGAYISSTWVAPINSNVALY